MERAGHGRAGGGRIAAAACAGLWLLAAGVAAAREERSVTVRGAVSDESGAPVPGHVVRVLKSRTILRLGSLERRDQDVEEVRATTDAHGLFEFTFPVDPQFRHYTLRFYDPRTFDAVKFRLPEDRDISRKVRRGRAVQATVVLRFAPDWTRVQALIEQHGAASHCGQILRALGVPDRVDPEAEGRELWSFDRAGVAYLVEGSRVLETRRLDPRPGEPPAAGEAGPSPGSGRDEATPATRVEEP
jgi:hypothetical protein